MDIQPGPFFHLFDLEPAPDDDQLAQEVGRPFGPMHASGQGANPRIPAGYTYLGQLIDHDLAFDPTMTLSPRGNAHPPRNFRTAAFDLDSVYGLGPNVSHYLYDPKNPRKLALGGNRNDVPRLGNVAVIGDPRNDENIIVSQLLTALLNFHNEVVDRENTSFEETRRMVRQHYQWIVLNDYLPRIVGRPLEAIQKEAESRGYPDNPLIPLEFSVAAFRFGHSQVRKRYDINSNVQGKARLILPDLAGHKQLEPVDHIEWSFFFELDRTNPPQPSLPIQPFIAPPMMNMPHEMLGPIDAEFERSVAYRDIRRGQLLGLPEAHAVAERLRIPKEMLVSKDFIWAAITERLRRAGSKYDPSGKPVPLWLYILFEAQELARGEHLGPVGGRLVSDVFLGLMKADPESVLSIKNWKPTLAGDGKFDIGDLLGFASKSNSGRS
jgi:hypothetical protein